MRCADLRRQHLGLLQLRWHPGPYAQRERFGHHQLCIHPPFDISIQPSKSHANHVNTSDVNYISYAGIRYRPLQRARLRRPRIVLHRPSRCHSSQHHRCQRCLHRYRGQRPRLGRDNGDGQQAPLDASHHPANDQVEFQAFDSS